MTCVHLGSCPVELSSAGRSSGVHLSGIVRAICAALGKPWAMDGAPDGHAAVLRMALGLAWEEWYAPRALGECYRPGEFEFDGVYFTPDAVDWSNRVVYEVKTTRKRAGTPPTEVLQWMLQIQAELWAIGRGEWTRAEFHVLYLGGHLPESAVWGLRFEPHELEACWNLILEYKHKAIPEVNEE